MLWLKWERPMSSVLPAPSRDSETLSGTRDCTEHGREVTELVQASESQRSSQTESDRARHRATLQPGQVQPCASWTLGVSPPVTPSRPPRCGCGGSQTGRGGIAAS